MIAAKLCRNLLGYPRTTAALHLISPRSKSSDTVDSLLLAARLITPAASPLAEQVSIDKQIIYARWPSWVSLFAHV